MALFPSVDVQKKIAELDALMREEADLFTMIIEKRKELITTACLQPAQKG
jgi:hypothetical protein